MNIYKAALLAFALLFISSGCVTTNLPRQQATGNKPQRVEWFRDLGLGMFINWSIDAQLGTVIGHSMVGASRDYLDRYINQLPKSFNPQDFKPAKWAELAKLAGMKYVVFDVKHHNGFCMYHTKTTNFNIADTPYKKDITRQVIEAFRKEGIAIGLYFSPDDFWLLYQQGHQISRRQPEVQLANNPQLLEHDKKQIRELLRNYGPIDIMFIDNLHEVKPGQPAYELPALCWQLQPDIVVTRGAMKTPEQYLPSQLITAPWEACFTMATSGNTNRPTSNTKPAPG
jgi:alpha-L-fucosidase